MPARFSDIKRAAEHFGVVFEAPKRGSHWKGKRAGYRTYPLACHNGVKSQIPDQYIRNMCRNFEIDAEEFLVLLRS